MNEFQVQVDQLKKSLVFFDGVSEDTLKKETKCEEKKGDEGRAAIIKREACHHLQSAITSLESHLEKPASK